MSKMMISVLLTLRKYGVLGLALSLLGCKAKVEESFVYQNPISIGIDSHGLRDCQIFRDGDWWYMTGTSYPFGLGEEKDGQLNKGIALYKSKDLVAWEFIKYIVERPDSSKWYYRRFWAPEIHKIQRKYYATFNCRNDELGYTWQHIGYAVSDHIEGPYTVVTDKEPLARGNDMTLFEDDDKRVYAFWHNVRDDGTFWLGSAEIDLSEGKFRSDTIQAIHTGKVEYEKDADGNVETIFRFGRNERKIKTFHEWDSQGIEGAHVIKRNGIYYLFYSSWTRGYEVGYATATDISGPWKKADHNPIYGGTRPELCEQRGFVCEQNLQNPFFAVGHNAVFEGPDSRLWLSCHGISRHHKSPYLVIDPLVFTAEGEIETREPSYTPQVIKW